MRADSILFTLCCLTALGVAIVLTLKVLLPWSYYVLSVLFGVVLVVMLQKMDSRPWLTYASIIVLALLIQNVYNLTTGFRIMPLFDSYNDYAAISLFLEQGRIYEHPLPGSGINTVHTFNWPLGAVLTMNVAQVTGMSVVHSGLFLTSVYGLVMLLIIMIFIRMLMGDSNRMYMAVAVGMLLFAIIPDAVYQRMVFYHRFISLTLFYIALYLIAKDYRAGHSTRRILLLLLTAGIVVSHIYVSYVWTLFLLIFVSISFLISLFSRRLPGMFSRVPRVSYVLPLVAFATGWLWNTEVIEGPFGALRNYLFQLFTLSFKEPFTEIIEPRYVVPEVLAGPPLNYILNLRDVAFYLPALIGLSIFLARFLRKRTADTRTTLLLIMGLTFAILSVIDYFGGPRRSIPAIVTSFALPFVVYFASQFYTAMISRGGAMRAMKIMGCGTLVFMVSMAFLAPWSHLYFARFLYDPSIEPKDVSMHEPASLQLTPFVREHFQPHEGEYILSDNRLLLLMILRPSEYPSIRFHGSTPHLIGAKNTYIFELIDLNPPFDLSQYSWPRNLVELEYSQVYDNNFSAIHYKGS